MTAATSAPPLSHEQLGVIATHLALTFPLWIRRRKTAFLYVDDTTVLQRQSVDVVLPQPATFPPHARPERGQLIYVPVFIADKASLVKFSITDETGAGLQILNTMENGGLATAGLNVLLSGLSGRQGRAVIAPNSLTPTIRAIVMASGHEGPGVAKFALGADRPLGRLLVHHDVYRALVTDLARGFLMLVPVTYVPGQNRCFKLQYETRQEWDVVKLPFASTRTLARIAASLSWSDTVQTFTRLPIGWAQGSHFEFDAPSDVRLGKATIDCRQWDPKRRRSVTIDRRRTVYDKPSINLNVSPRVTFDPWTATDERRSELLSCRQDVARVTLRMRPVLSSVIGPICVASAATSALLWVVASRIEQLDGQTSAALLLLFPAIVVAFLARSGEHAFATRLLSGVRVLAAAVTLCALLMVAIVAGGFVRDPEEPPRAATIACPPAAVSPLVAEPLRRPFEPTETACEVIVGAEPRNLSRDEARPIAVAAAATATALTTLLLFGVCSVVVAGRARAGRPDEQSLRVRAERVDAR